MFFKQSFFQFTVTQTQLITALIVAQAQKRCESCEMLLIFLIFMFKMTLTKR